MEMKERIKKMKAAGSLLKEFNLDIYGFDPGVSAIDENGIVFQFIESWEWLEPLLIELRNYRHLKIKLIPRK